MTPAETLARIRLARTEGVGPTTFRRLIQRHGSGAAALEALPGHGGRAMTPPPTSAVEREMAALTRLGGQFLVLGDPAYPPLLLMLEDPPPVL